MCSRGSTLQMTEHTELCYKHTQKTVGIYTASCRNIPEHLCHSPGGQRGFQWWFYTGRLEHVSGMAGKGCFLKEDSSS